MDDPIILVFVHGWSELSGSGSGSDCFSDACNVKY